jgi:hypothetical protein
MWKPGEERQHTGQKSKGKTKNRDGSSKSNPAVKRLSTGTMNMRFMQRTASVSPKQAKQHDTSRAEGGNSSTGVEMADHNVSESTNCQQTVVDAEMTQDMYGTILLGRRSFGSFKPVVDQIYQQSLLAVSKKEGKRKRKRS